MAPFWFSFVHGAHIEGGFWGDRATKTEIFAKSRQERSPIFTRTFARRVCIETMLTHAKTSGILWVPRNLPMDATINLQLVWAVLAGLLTLTVIILLVYVILILKEVRGTLKKVDYAMGKVTDISEFLSNPLPAVTTVATLVAEILKSRGIVRLIKIKL